MATLKKVCARGEKGGLTGSSNTIAQRIGEKKTARERVERRISWEIHTGTQWGNDKTLFSVVFFFTSKGKTKPHAANGRGEAVKPHFLNCSEKKDNKAQKRENEGKKDNKARHTFHDT